MLRRLVMTFFVVILIMTFLALLIHLVPGDPVRLLLGAKAPEQLILQVRHQMYLDKPVPAQVYYFFWNALHGNLGVDFASQRPVTSLIWIALAAHDHPRRHEPPARGGGRHSARRLRRHSPRRLDRPRGDGDLRLADHHAGLRGRAPAAARVLGALRRLPATGFGNVDNPADYLKHLILPAIALSVAWMGYLARLVRTSMLEVLNERYIYAARAQGIRDRVVVYKYALRNAVIPTIAILAVGLGQLMGGAIFIEVIFARPGLGMLIYNSIETRNYPVVRGGVLVVALLFVAVNLATDFVYHWIDPRIRVVS